MGSYSRRTILTTQHSIQNGLLATQFRLRPYLHSFKNMEKLELSAVTWTRTETATKRQFVNVISFGIFGFSRWHFHTCITVNVNPVKTNNRVPCTMCVCGVAETRVEGEKPTEMFVFLFNRYTNNRTRCRRNVLLTNTISLLLQEKLWKLFWLWWARYFNLLHFVRFRMLVAPLQPECNYCHYSRLIIQSPLLANWNSN